MSLTRSGRIPYAEDIARILDCNPFEILCRFAMGDHIGLGLKRGKITADLRFYAAKEAAQYIHPKRRAVEHSGPDGGPINVKEQLVSDLVQTLEDLAVVKANQEVEEQADPPSSKKPKNDRGKKSL